MRHLTSGILQDPQAPDRYYFSPGRVLQTVANMLAEQPQVDQGFAAIVAGELVCQAVQAEAEYDALVR